MAGLGCIMANNTANRRSVFGNLGTVQRGRGSSSIIVIRSNGHPVVDRSVVASGLIGRGRCNSTMTAVPYARIIFISRGGVSSSGSVPHRGLREARAPRSCELDSL